MRTICILLIACLSAALAQRWPMITVNSAGEIVLQSLTRAVSFQVTPRQISTGPLSPNTGSATTATALQAGVRAYEVTVPGSRGTNHGLTLPTCTLGARVTLYMTAASPISYTLYAKSGNFINADSLTTSILVSSTSRKCACECVSASRWNCMSDALGGSTTNVFINTYINVTTSVNINVNVDVLSATTIIGGIWNGAPSGSGNFTLVVDSASNITYQAGSGGLTGDAYEVMVCNNATETGTSSKLITLAPPTDGSVVIPNDGTEKIPPGQTRVYLIYRTGTNSYRMIQKSTYRKVLPVVACGLAPAACHAGHGTLTTPSGMNPGTIWTSTIQNAHAVLGQPITFYVSGMTAGTYAKDAQASIQMMVIADGLIKLSMINNAEGGVGNSRLSVEYILHA